MQQIQDMKIEFEVDKNIFLLSNEDIRSQLLRHSERQCHPEPCRECEMSKVCS